MKFQDSSLNGFKVRVGTKKCDPRTHDAPTHAQKAICPTNFFQVGGIIIYHECKVGINKSVQGVTCITKQ